MSKNKEVTMDKLKNFHITAEWPALENVVKLYMRMAVYEKLNEIRAEIGMYEADCRLQDDCERCITNVFGSIYQIIHKHMAESENKE